MMPEKEITANADYVLKAIPIMLAVLLSCVGGIVNYLNKIDKNGMAFSLFHFSVEIITSAFVGIISFVLCDSAEFSWTTTAAIVAISGHMGTRALFLIEDSAVSIAKTILRRNGYDGNSERKTERPEETNIEATREEKK